MDKIVDGRGLISGEMACTQDPVDYNDCLSCIFSQIYPFLICEIGSTGIIRPAFRERGVLPRCEPKDFVFLRRDIFHVTPRVIP